MATSNRIRALNRLPFDFEDGLKVGGVDVTSLNQLATTNGAGLVGYDNGTVQDALDAVTGPNGAASVGYTPAGTGAVATTVQSKLRETVSVRDFGAVGDGATKDTAAFQIAEADPDRLDFYLPSGTYPVDFYSLSKRYFGPGKIVFQDGEVQEGVEFGAMPPRNIDGPVILSSPSDIRLSPNGNVDFDRKRILNINDPVADFDGVNLRTLVSKIAVVEQLIANLSPLSQTRGTFTPAVSGSTTAGTGSYTTQSGRYVITGKMIFISCELVWSDHTGTGNVKISVPPNVQMIDGGGVSGLALGSITRSAGEMHCYFVNGSIQLLLTTSGADPTAVAIAASGSLSLTITLEIV